MNKKRWLGSVVTMLMVLSLVLSACTNNGNNGNQSSSKPSEKPVNTDAGSSKEPQDLEKVTFTVFNGVSGKTDINSNETRIGKILEDQTGVNFKVEYLVGELNAKIGTMNAGRKYPDVLIPDDAISQVLDAEAFIDLLPLIEKYAPNIKRVYEPFFNLMKDKDGHIWYLPMSAQVNEYLGEPGESKDAFFIQRRVLEWADFPKIKSMDQYFQLIEDFIAAHPNENLIGYSTLTDDWRMFATTNAPNHLAGYPNDGGVQVDMDTYEAKIYSGTEDEYRWYKKLNEFNAKGLFDKNSFVDNYDQYLAKLTSHNVLGFSDQGWQFGNARDVLTDAARKDPSQDGFRYFPVPLTFDESIEDQWIGPPGFVTNRGIGITVSAKNPERIIKYWDNLLTDDNQILVKWGVEGETYERDANGRLVRTQEMINKIDRAFSDDFGLTLYSWDWPQYGANSTLSDGNAANPGTQPEVFNLGLTEADKKIFAKYNVNTYAELFNPPVDRPWYPAWGLPKEQGSAPEIFETRKDALLRKWVSQLVLSEPSKFEDVWKSYTDELNKLDVKGYEEWYTQAIRDFVAKVKGE